MRKLETPEHPFVARCMARLAAFCDRRAWLVIGVTVVLFVLAAFATHWHLGYASDRSIVLANSSPYFFEYQAFKREFGASDALFFVVRGPDRAVNHRAALDIGRLAREDTTHFANVVDHIDLSFLRQRFLLFLPVNDLKNLDATLRSVGPLLNRLLEHPGLGPLFTRVNSDVQDWLQSIVARPRVGHRSIVTLASVPPAPPPGLESVPFLQAVPLFTRLLQGMSGAVQGVPQATALDELFSVGNANGNAPTLTSTDLWIEFRNGQTVLVSAEANITGDRTEAIESTVQEARRIVQVLRQRYPSLEIGVTGTPAIDSDEMRQAEIDSFNATALSLLGLVVLFCVAFCNVTRPLLALVALIVSLVLTLGFVAVTLGHLNLLTVTALPMLVGLGIDFGIQVISRYEEERKAGLEPASAMSDTLQFTGASIVTAGVTTAISFGVVYFSGFVGVQEMAVVAGAGIAIGVLCMTVLLPSLILVAEQSTPWLDCPDAMRKSPWKLMEAIERAVLVNPRTTLVLVLLFTAMCVSQLSRVRYDWNPLHLQDPTSPSVREAMELMNASDRSILWAAVAVADPNEARLLTERFRALGTVGDVLSAAPLIPADQDLRLDFIRKIQTSLKPIRPKLASPPKTPTVRLPQLTAAIRGLRRVALIVYPEAQRVAGETAARNLKTFVAAADDLLQSVDAGAPAKAASRLDGYQRALFSELYKGLRALVDPLQATPIGVDTLPAALRRQFVGRNGTFMVQVFPAGNVWERGALKAFLEQVRAVAPHATGPAVEVYESGAGVKTGYERVTLYALVAIVILTMMHFQSVGGTLLALTPLALGVLWMLGLQGLLNLPFNGANLLSLSLILGIGVANGIYIVRRFEEEGRPTIFTQSTGRAILMSNLSALIGFGSLLVSSYRGLYTFGQIMSIGIIACMVASLVALPALLSLPWFSQHDDGVTPSVGAPQD